MLTLSAPKKTHRGLIVSAIIFVLLAFGSGGYTYAILNLPAPEPVFNQSLQTGAISSGDAVKISWPSSAQAAVGATGFGVLETYGSETPLPTASVAKIIAALAILKAKPLELNQPGSTITLTTADRQIYNDYVAIGGSVVPVQAGEQITQYQALQAMLIPSANNMAESLTNWAFGSEAAYRDYANQMLADMGLKNSYVYDASGMSPKTVSTARELVLIGEAAIQNPVIAQIVAQPEATIPVAGRIVTTNKVMGQAGINGIKTGHTNQSGGCFLFAAARDVGGKPVTIVAAIMAAPTIDDARAAAPGLIESSLQGFVNVAGIKSGQVVGTIKAPWAEAINVTANTELSKLMWKGTKTDLTLSEVATNVRDGTVGSVKFGSEQTSIAPQSIIPEPDFWWRFTHPLELIRASN